MKSNMQKVYRARCLQTRESWEAEDLKLIYKIARMQLRDYVEEARSAGEDYRCDMVINSMIREETITGFRYYDFRRIMGMSQGVCKGYKTVVITFRQV